MYTMSETTKKNLEESLGISLPELSKVSADEEREWIEKKIGKKLTFSKKRKHRIIGRRNPLLSRKRICTIEDLEEKSIELFGV
ncbi:MAG: hypothetical protein LUD81_03025 [Clostridiales bacterium]|nr:hypothetical protein [Clostridiales bacterium]